MDITMDVSSYVLWINILKYPLKKSKIGSHSVGNLYYKMICVQLSGFFKYYITCVIENCAENRIDGQTCMGNIAESPIYTQI